MKITDVFIKRPVFASCLSLLLVVIGLISFWQLTLREYPKISTNTISIQTSYPGANASLVESFVTTPLENAISGVDGIDYMSSSSSANQSNITIYLKMNTDLNQAVTDINTDISAVKKTLPDSVNDPIVRSSGASATADMIVAFSSKTMASEEISDYITRTIQPQLSNLSGVGSVQILGQRTYAMRIWLNTSKMRQYNITAADVIAALQNNNIQSEAGEIDREYQAISINAETTLANRESFANLVIKNINGKLLRLQNIAKVTLGALDTTTSVTVDGSQGVGVAITAKTEANPLSVDQEVKQALIRIQTTLPKGMTYSIPRDSSNFISQSVNEVVSTIIEAVVLVILVIFLFIGSIRATLIPVITIPLSLIGTFAFMHFMGFSINTLTLLAFVLAIGMVVDDAIVVLENIYRHIEEGLSGFQAAIKGAREITFAVIAMTITLFAVYIPIGFTSGFTGVLFREFSFTLAGAVVISGFIALTLSPMMCSKIMKAGINTSGFSAKVERISHRASNSYKSLLIQVLKNRAMVFIVLSGVLISGLVIFIPFYLTSTLAPNEDQGVIMSIANGPSAANVEYTGKYTQQLQKIYANNKDIQNSVIIDGIPNGQNTALSFVNLVDYSKRKASVNDIVKTLSDEAAHIPGLSFMFASPPSLPGATQLYPFQFVLKTNGSYEELYQVSNQFMQAIGKNKGVLFARSDLQMNKPELSLTINRNKASLLGIPMTAISQALTTAFGQPQTSTFVMNGKTYYVVPQVKNNDRNSIPAINNINVKTASGASIPLSTIVSIKNTVSADSLNHFQQQRAATINMVLNPAYSTKSAVDFLTGLAKNTLPSDMSYDFSGTTRTYVESGNTMALLFIAALIFIYLVLSAQFESFRDPLIVLLTVPLSIVGALFTLFFAGGSLNIYTEIGLLTLVGLISKHGILMVEFANQLQKQGVTRLQAIIEASAKRFRPILMTTVAMLLGVLPLAFASGAGAEARSQMGWVIFGGMFFGTLLTLFVIPTMYNLLGKHYSSKEVEDESIVP